MCAACPPRPTPCSHLAFSSVAARCGAFPPWVALRARPAAGRRVGQRNQRACGQALSRRSVPHASDLRALAHSACHPDPEAQPARPPHTAAPSVAAQGDSAAGQRHSVPLAAPPSARPPRALAVWGVARAAHPPALGCSVAGAQTSGNVQPTRTRWARVSRPLPDERPRTPRSPCRVWVPCFGALPWRGCAAVAARGSAPRHVPPAPASAPLATARGQPASAGPCGAERGRSGSRPFSLWCSSRPPPPRGDPRPAWRPRSAGSPAPPLRALRGRSVCRRRAGCARRLRTSLPTRALARVRCPCPPPRPLPLGGGGCACPPFARCPRCPGACGRALPWLFFFFWLGALAPLAWVLNAPRLLGAYKLSNTLVFSPFPQPLKVLNSA